MQLHFCLVYIIFVFFLMINYILYCTLLPWVCLELRTDIILFLPQLYHSPKPLLRSPWVEEINLENEIFLVAYSVFSRLSSEGVPLVVSAIGFSSAGFSPTFSLGKIDQSGKLKCAYSIFSCWSSEGVPLVVSATEFSSTGASPTFSLGKRDKILEATTSKGKTR